MGLSLLIDMIDPLTEIAIKYGNDRHPWSKHSYTPYYYKLFQNRQKSIKKILEIGVGEGKGLRMWQDFFPNAKIYGAEIDPARIFKQGHIEVIYCDQTKDDDLMALLKKTGTDIDFVVEDASHKPADQVFTCLTLMPHLAKEIIYIIEDVADLSICEKLLSYNLLIPKLERRRQRYDDRLVVVTY